MEVLFISGIDGFCHRYEVLHRAAQLHLRAIATTVRHFTDPRSLDDVARSSAVFLYRTPESPLVRELIGRARRAGQLVLGSIDDLLFVPEPSALPPLEHLDEQARDLWLDGIARYRATLELCDAFVAAAEPLAVEAERMGLPAYLHRDAASAIELRLGARARQARRARLRAAGGSRRVTLGYFSGTATHDADFEEARTALLELMHRRPEVDLLIVGPLILDQQFAAFGSRVRRQALVPWPELPEVVAQADVSLAPLAWRERFAAAKGEGKYIEAGSVAIPTVASPSPAFHNAIRDSETGRLAADPAQWLAALEELTADPARREAMGDRAFTDVHARFSPEPRAEELVHILRDARSSRPGRARVEPLAAPRSGTPAAGEHPAHRALEPDGCPDLLPAAPVGESPPLGAGSLLRQRFTARHDGLFRIDVRTLTYGQALSHHLSFELAHDADHADDAGGSRGGAYVRGRVRGDDGEAEVRDGRARIAKWQVEARHLPDRAWFALELPAQPDSRGRRYTLTVTAAGTGAGNATSFALACAGGVDTPCATLDGQPLAGALELRSFAQWETILGTSQEDTIAGHGA